MLGSGHIFSPVAWRLLFERATKMAQEKLVIRNFSKIYNDISKDEYFVWWDDITIKKVNDYRKFLNGAKRESDLQQYLEEHPELLIQYLRGGHGRWVVPKKRLGSEFIPDFMLAEKSSLGTEWYAVELESPSSCFFNKNGDPSKTLNHAIRQIIDWRMWLKNNLDYASRKKTENGLGLTDIDGTVRGLILMGRRSILDAHSIQRRRQLGKELDIEIHTYDWLADISEGRVESLSGCHQIKKEKRE